MSSLATVEIKAFVLTKDFALSKRFYQDFGFTLASDGGGIAYFHCDNCSFLLQDFYVPGYADNFMVHLLVEDAYAWWAQVQGAGLVEKYAITLTPPAEQPWGMVDFVLTDPSGVKWRIAHNLPPLGPEKP